MNRVRDVQLIAVLAFGLLILTGPASAAKPPLREVAQIDDGLLYVALANEIRRNCDSITPRILRAIAVLQRLKSDARALGYTEAEIDAYTESEAEKDRMRARGAAYLAAHGVEPGNAETYCALGRAEIAKSSAIGALLRAK